MSGYKIENNTFIDSQVGVFIGGGRRNLVANNTMRHCDTAVHFDQRGHGCYRVSCFPNCPGNCDASTVWGCAGLSPNSCDNPHAGVGNVTTAANGSVLHLGPIKRQFVTPPWSTRFPELGTVLESGPMVEQLGDPILNRIVDNVVCGCTNFLPPICSPSGESCTNDIKTKWMGEVQRNMVQANCSSARAIKSDDANDVSVSATHTWNSPPVRIPSNSTTDAPLLGNGELGVAHGGDLASRNLTFFLGANSFWSAPTGGISQCGFRDADMLFMHQLGAGGGVRQLGGLTLQVGQWTAAERGSYHAHQAVENATVYQTHTRSDGVRLHLTSHVVADEDTILINVSWTGSGKVLVDQDLEMVLWTRGGCHYGSHGCNRTSQFPPLTGGPTKPSLITDSSSFTACTFPTRAGALPAGGYVSRASGLNFQQTRGFNVSTLSVAMRMLLANGSEPQLDTSVIDSNSQTGSDAVRIKLRLVRGKDGQMPAFTLVLAMRNGNDAGLKKPTGFDDRAIHLATTRLQELSTPQSLLPLLHSSYDWWRTFWSQSSVSFGTSSELGARLEAFYRGSSFLLAASSRTGEVAPGLYGPWITTDHPMWGGDFHVSDIFMYE